MSNQQASATWTGNLKEGSGEFNLPKANVSSQYTFASRFEDGNATNPEELIGAAIASCYSMFLSALATKAEFQTNTINTTATVTLERDDTGPCITNISLDVTADIERIDEETFQNLVNESLEKCPISRLYSSVNKTVTAKRLTAA